MNKKSTNNKPDEKLCADVMSQIKDGQVEMRSQRSIQLHSVAIGVLLGVSVGLGVMFVALLHRSIVHNELLELARFGPAGRNVALEKAPYELLVLAVLALACAYILSKRYRLCYKRSTYIVIGTLFISSVGVGIVLSETNAVNPLRTIPPIQRIGSFETEQAQRIGGLVTEVGVDFVIVEDFRTGEEVRVELETEIPGSVIVGEIVGAVGAREGSLFKATAIRTGRFFDRKPPVRPRQATDGTPKNR